MLTVYVFILQRGEIEAINNKRQCVDYLSNKRNMFILNKKTIAYLLNPATCPGPKKVIRDKIMAISCGVFSIPVSNQC